MVCDLPIQTHVHHLTFFSRTASNPNPFLFIIIGFRTCKAKHEMLNKYLGVGYSPYRLAKYVIKYRHPNMFYFKHQ